MCGGSDCRGGSGVSWLGVGGQICDVGVDWAGLVGGCKQGGPGQRRGGWSGLGGSGGLSLLATHAAHPAWGQRGAGGRGVPGASLGAGLGRWGTTELRGAGALSKAARRGLASRR